MRKVQINIYSYRQPPERIVIEVPDNVQPAEVMNLASKSLSDQQRAKNWDWNFIYN